MDRFIIQGIQQLHVLATYCHNNMEELPQDFKNALDDAADCRISCNKLRKGRSWNCRSKHKCSLSALGSSVPKSSAISDESESSLDNRLQYLMDISTNGSHHQIDSDEIISKVTCEKHQWRHCAANVGESDSVNENFRPSREPRNKRKFKRMSVDPTLITNHEYQSSSNVPSFSQKSKRLRNLKSQKPSKLTVKTPAVSQFSAEMENVCRNFRTVGASCGKRKRCAHEKSNECNSCDGKSLIIRKHDSEGISAFPNSCHHSIYAVKSRSQEICSSGLSSSESESGILTNDESREADDEQSDFFHESGPVDGVAGFSSWWQNEELISSNNMTDPEFETLLSESLRDMSDTAKEMYTIRVNDYKGGRHMRCGRRRLETGVSIISTHMNDLGSDVNVPIKKEYACFSLSFDNCSAKIVPNEQKKRRQMPPLTNSIHRCDDSTTPLPESNIGFRMLQNMGWKPGTGLGPSGEGIISPIKSSVCGNKQRLGFCERKINENYIPGTAPHFGWRNCSCTPPPPPPSPEPFLDGNISPS